MKFIFLRTAHDALQFSLKRQTRQLGEGVGRGRSKGGTGTRTGLVAGLCKHPALNGFGLLLLSLLLCDGPSTEMCLFTWPYVRAQECVPASMCVCVCVLGTKIFLHAPRRMVISMQIQFSNQRQSTHIQAKLNIAQADPVNPARTRLLLQYLIVQIKGERDGKRERERERKRQMER